MVAIYSNNVTYNVTGGYNEISDMDIDRNDNDNGNCNTDN